MNENLTPKNAKNGVQLPGDSEKGPRLQKRSSDGVCAQVLMFRPRVGEGVGRGAGDLRKGGEVVVLRRETNSRGEASSDFLPRDTLRRTTASNPGLLRQRVAEFLRDFLS